MKKLLILFSFMNCIGVNANCLKDIFAVGIGATSTEFSLVEQVGSSNINSSSGLNVLGEWVLFCPAKRLEVVNQIELRNYKFVSDTADVSELDKSVTLLSFNSSASYIYKSRIELLGKTEVGEDLFFKRDVNTGKINYQENLILNMLIGIKYNAFKIKDSDIFTHLLIGPRFSFSDYSEGIGTILEIGASTIYKIGKYKSLSLNLHYKKFQQDMNNLEQSNKDLTFNSSYLIRF